MRAIRVFEGGETGVVDLDLPRVKPTEVLVAVDGCGICGTDLRRISVGLSTGLTPGHEFAGVVAELGSAVTEWQVGDRVAVCPFVTCGECAPCRSGASVVHCEREGEDWNWSGGTKDGGFAESVVVDQVQLVRVPDSLSLSHAALAEPLACGLHAVTISGISPEKSAAVIGAGPIGVLTVLALKARGVEQIVVVQRSEARRRFVEEHLDTPTVGLGDAVADVRAVLGGPADFAFDCSGNREAITLGCSLVPPRADVIAAGISSEPFMIEPFGLVVRERRVLGCAAYSTAEFAAAVSVLADSPVPIDPLITSTIDLDATPRVITALRAGGRREDLKIQVRP